MPAPADRNRRNTPPTPASPPEVVDPRWIIKALGIVVVAALVCGYLTLCLLFYQGQWQLILHPKQTTSSPAAIAGAKVDFLHFGPDESGVPQLTGWSITPPLGGRFRGVTVLLLPSGDGSLQDQTDLIEQLLSLGVNIFAIDYRGYGQNVTSRPNQEKMTWDTETAWQYLTRSQGLTEKQIVLYGVGVGGSLATHLAAEHPNVAALIIDTPGTDPLEITLNDPRTKLLPVRMLFHNRFPLAEPLSHLKTPKLLLAPGSNSAFAGAMTPKVTVSLPNRTDAQYRESLTRFLDEYLPPTGLLQLVPPPKP